MKQDHPYDKFIPRALQELVRGEATPIPAVAGMLLYGTPSGLETEDALGFLATLFRATRARLEERLRQRERDRAFLDARFRVTQELNARLGRSIDDPNYVTPIGAVDGQGRVVFGPLTPDFATRDGEPVAPYPEHWRGHQVTLFGPPDTATMAINAMNAFHRVLDGEPPIVGRLLAETDLAPRWGADLEDSKTPLREDMVRAASNLTACIAGDLEYTDPARGKHYALASDRLAQPIKRFPGLALPCPFLYVDDQPVPLHLYDFALHLWHNWMRPDGLVFYVPKLENEEEARYVHDFIEVAESLVAQRYPDYRLGTVRLMIVLENPRAILRAHEIIDALHPYFLGMSLGWHDYLASTARVFREDPHYRIPVKADPDIVIKHIKASHDLVTRVSGGRGGMAIGGMYGILPVDRELQSPSFQLALKGYFRDVITQLKRGLSGFWVAHPDFVRLGLAIVTAWDHRVAGDSEPLAELVRALLRADHADAVLAFIEGDDISSLDESDPAYVRHLLAADMVESDFIANNDPEEVRFNVFQALQYLADWLAGTGCVALPTVVDDTAVRVMDDLATTERSRWEVWHEIRHGRFDLGEFLKIAREEFDYIRYGRAEGTKLVRVHWDQRTGPWYPVAYRILIQLMTAPEPVEFASELLLPFTVQGFRDGTRSLDRLRKLDPRKYELLPRVERYLQYFEGCGLHRFAWEASENPIYEKDVVEQSIGRCSLSEIGEAASHHGDIGAARKTMDSQAATEQAAVLEAEEDTRKALLARGHDYREKFGFKYLVAARGRSAADLLAELEERLDGHPDTEAESARQALARIANQRLGDTPPGSFCEAIDEARERAGVLGVSLAVSEAICHRGLGGPAAERAPAGQALVFGRSGGSAALAADTLFDVASLSKTIGTAFALETLFRAGYGVETPVRGLLESLGSPFALRSAGDAAWVEQLRVADLAAHTGMGMHYVHAIPFGEHPGDVAEILVDPSKFGYGPIELVSEPGTRFAYSGAGFLLLEHLARLVLGDAYATQVEAFVAALGELCASELYFDRTDAAALPRALGHFDDGSKVSEIPHWFPGYAAGMLATPRAYLAFLGALGEAWLDPESVAPISHETARWMLRGRDLGSREFMGLDMGLGVFIGEAGPNRLAIHQGANEGYRAISIYCFAGPDRGAGLVACANGDNAAVPLLAEVARQTLSSLQLRGVDFALADSAFSAEAVEQAEIVNRGYRDLVFRACQRMTPEVYAERGPEEPILAASLLRGATIVDVSNQRFARAANLLSAYRPVFDPSAFGSQGKIMDSWETERHNPLGVDRLVLAVDEYIRPTHVYVSTEYHDGNHAEGIEIEGAVVTSSDEETEARWEPVLARTPIEGHAHAAIRLDTDLGSFNRFRVSTYPDGGLTRVGLYTADPAARLSTADDAYSDRVLELFTVLAAQSMDSEPRVSRRFDHSIPRPLKHPCLPSESARVLAQPTGTVDLASEALGARVTRVTNEHYGPASALLSPFAPLHMFDGFESARSRDTGHFEEVDIELGQSGSIQEIHLDFRYFVNNNPRSVRLFARTAGDWTEIVPNTPVKAFAGTTKTIRFAEPRAAEALRLRLIPDGGINRLRAFGIPDNPRITTADSGGGNEESL